MRREYTITLSYDSDKVEFLKPRLRKTPKIKLVKFEEFILFCSKCKGENKLVNEKDYRIELKNKGKEPMPFIHDKKCEHCNKKLDVKGKCFVEVVFDVRGQDLVEVQNVIKTKMKSTNGIRYKEFGYKSMRNL